MDVSKRLLRITLRSFTRQKLFTLITVSPRTIRGALANPAHSLRRE